MSDFLNDRDFKRFRDYIYEKSGINFCTSNRMILESRLKELLRRNGLSSLDEYFKLISSNNEELKILLDAVTTNLTRFFRNQGHFDAFRNYVIPKLVEYKKSIGNRDFRIWSAGCSTGEEPYSLAMVLKDLLPPDFKIKVLASDLSLKSLLVAKTGRYEASKVKDISDEYLARFFDFEDGVYEVNEEIKKIVQFDYHNLTFESYVGDIDVVFCRNVLIYFDEAAQVDTIHKFWASMRPFSFLFIGHSESLFGLGTPFEFVKTDWTCFYSKSIE
ncbi:MAG: protein-glutamate O-methyltransferase CheR [Spirochaetales bacterium]|nr:protein-glutamate O-methyltransferase CheR [Spirochaetales bacterium]